VETELDTVEDRPSGDVRSQGVSESITVGIDIGGTKVAAGIVAREGGIVHVSQARTPRSTDPMKVVELVLSLLGRELAAASTMGLTVTGIGVGTAGVVNPTSRSVVSATENLSGWASIDLAALLTEASGVQVLVDNDVNAIAIAETSVGVARAYDRCLVVSVGTGVGGALVVDGEVDRGATGTAGEIGHLPIGPVDGPVCSCGRRGHLEAYASGPSMHRDYAAASTAASVPDYRAVARLASKGDPVARRVVAAGAAVLGRALGGLVNVLDPACVVLGGGVIGSGRAYVDAVRAAFRVELLPATALVPILISDPSRRAGVVGAGISAHRAFGAQ
jgi:glucokinase